MIPDSFKQDLLNRVDIVDVIERYVPLKKTGSNFSACCPFHTEKSPSFTVSPTKQFYHCFGCGAHGNVITFVAPEAEVATLRALRRHLRPGGVCVAGFQPERYAITTFDADALAAGFVIEQRFATWDLRPWDDEAEFAVTVLRNPDE